MTTAKNIFLTDRVLSDWFRGIVNQTQFEKCLAFVDAELINLPGLTAEKLNGAREYKKILMTLAEVDDEARKVFKPLLDQNFDQLPPSRQPKPKIKESPNENPA